MKKQYLLIGLIFTIGLFFSSYGQKVLTLQPGPTEGIDTYICSVLPDHVGYADGFLVTAWTLDGQPYVGMNVFKFDLSQIPHDAIILEAKLSLFFDPNGSWFQNEGANSSFIKRVTSKWDKMTVCWANKPASAEAGKIDLPETTEPQQDLTDIDIKAFVEGWVADASTNYGMLMGLYNQDPYACLVLSSSDGTIPARRPKLVVTYSDCTLPESGFSAKIDGLTAMFTDQSSNALNWKWDFDDGSSSFLQNPVHSYLSQGKYEVCLTVQDSCGSNTFCDSIETICNAPLVTWYYDTHGTFVDFFDTTAGANGWLWNFGDESYDSIQNPTHEYIYEGSYLVCLTAYGSCGSDTHCDTVQSYNTLSAPFGIHSEGHLIFFSDLTENAISWYWKFGDGSTSELQNPSHYFEKSGQYYVCLKVTLPSGIMYGCDSVLVLPDGLSKGISNSINFYPNPVENFLKLHRNWLSPDDAEVSISNLQGIVVYSYRIHFSPGEAESSIDLGSLESGLYFVRIISGSNNKIAKFVKAE